MTDIDRLKNSDETLDTFYHGRILVLQKKRGYRFAVDAPLLADFIQPCPSDELLELGCGCGVISLLLSRKAFSHIICLEIQPSLADLARRNVTLNHLEEKITVIEADLRTYSPGRKFDIIFANPPYFKQATGWVSQLTEKAIARHEIMVDAKSLLGKTSELLKPDGRCYFIYRANRYPEITEIMRINRLFPWRIRWVQPRPKQPPRFFLIEAGRSERAVEELDPLFLFDATGKYSAEARRIFAGENNA